MRDSPAGSRPTTWAIVGTGDMGSAVGAVLTRQGLNVLTDGSRRSEHSRRLARAAGIEDVGSLSELIARADVFLSILPPAAALELAQSFAAACEEGGATPLFVDCNAVSPATLADIEQVILRCGAPFADVGIVGPAPRAVPGRKPTRFYVAGAERSALLALDVPEIEVVDMGPETGRASAIKMCYAALNKGTDALLTAILLAAEGLGVRPELMTELAASQPEAEQRMQQRVPFLGSTSRRFTGEMREIASTFAAVGVTPDFHRGAEWVYALLAETPYAEETRAEQPAHRSLDEALRTIETRLRR